MGAIESNLVARGIRENAERKDAGLRYAPESDDVAYRSLPRCDGDYVRFLYPIRTTDDLLHMPIKCVFDSLDSRKYHVMNEIPILNSMVVSKNRLLSAMYLIWPDIQFLHVNNQIIAVKKIGEYFYWKLEVYKYSYYLRRDDDYTHAVIAFRTFEEKTRLINKLYLPEIDGWVLPAIYCTNMQQLYKLSARALQIHVDPSWDGTQRLSVNTTSDRIIHNKESVISIVKTLIEHSYGFFINRQNGVIYVSNNLKHINEPFEVVVWFTTEPRYAKFMSKLQATEYIDVDAILDGEDPIRPVLDKEVVEGL